MYKAGHDTAYFVLPPFRSFFMLWTSSSRPDTSRDSLKPFYKTSSLMKSHFASRSLTQIFLGFQYNGIELLKDW